MHHKIGPKFSVLNYQRQHYSQNFLRLYMMLSQNVNNVPYNEPNET